MAHYAFLDSNSVVTEVITGVSETEFIEGIDPETWYGNFRGQVCKRTSYNTRHGVHLSGKTPLRVNFAGIGYTYDALRDAFIPPKPFSSWIFNDGICDWEPPIPRPEESPSLLFRWNEVEQNWTPAE